MKPLSDITCCIVDRGLFLQMARVMAEGCPNVLYFNPDRRGFPSVKQGYIGEGFDEFKLIGDLWRHVDEIDLFCFPDSRDAGLQLHLEKMGKAVWGSRRSQELEQNRLLFLRTLNELGLDVPEYTACLSLDALREHLEGREDQYIKISHWRGDMETTHWRNWEMDHSWLDWLSVTMGPLAQRMTFLVFPAIKTDLEIGADLFAVDSQLPSLMLHGIEGKDKSYFAAVTKTKEMPEQLLSILQAFRPLLGSYRHRNQLSMEVRESFFIDATQRAGMPSTGSQHLLWINFPEIVWQGANGVLVEPKAAAKFSIETMITSKGTSRDCWDVVEIPAALERACRFSNCCKVGEHTYTFPPDELMGADLGWLVATGDTPTETIDQAKELADQLPDGLNADVESLAPVIQEIALAQAEGITFTKQKMPEPAEVLE